MGHEQPANGLASPPRPTNGFRAKVVAYAWEGVSAGTLGGVDPASYSIRSSRIVADGVVCAGVVHVRGEKIERVELEGDGGVAGFKQATTPPERVLDVGDLVVMPGLVDTHVHVNEPGRTDWEGFLTAGRAAAAGGITTIVVMPLNCMPAATNVAALVGEAEAARGKCSVDYGFWGGVVPGNVDELEPMWEAGALGFKCFLVDSGVPDFPAISMNELFRKSSAPLSRLRAPLLAHAEDAGMLARAYATSGLSESPKSYNCYLASRPPDVEYGAVEDLIGCLAVEGVHVHIVHVSGSSKALWLINDSKRKGALVTAETCPHYLTFAAEEIPDGATQFKCAPPIRDREIRETLWEALRNGTLDMVVSDHSPCPPNMKLLEQGDFAKAWGGVSSLQLGLSATWTGAQERGFVISDIARWMCAKPAVLGGFSLQKGQIAAGFDADLVIFDPAEQWTVRGQSLHHRHKLTPYDGMTLRGVVKRTILRGRTIFDASLANPFPSEPIGQWIKRGSN